MLCNALSAQVSENFSDGNFTVAPKWIGNTADFIVNDQARLQTNNTIANSTFFLSTANTLAIETEWTFWVQLAFNPSSANYVDAFLTASASDLSLNSTYGYFVRLGGTDDEICLYRKSATGEITKIIQGSKQILNTSNNIIKVKVTRDEKDKWVLSRDLSGTGNNYIVEGSVEDKTFNSSAYFGFLIKQSTASFFQKHFFDDIQIKNYVPDLTPPSVVSATAVSNNSIHILFNEPLDKTSTEIPDNYFSNNGLGIPSTVSLDAQNGALVHLTYNQIFTNGVDYSMIIAGVKDLAGNEMTNGFASFSFHTPQRYDVIISEIFPDPSPQIGLPPLKFLELKNNSTRPVNLQGWKIMDGNSTATLPAYRLLPDSFVIVTATNSVSSYLGFGPVLGVANFPSMNIGGATIILQSASGMTMHAMQYDLTSYKNDLKKDGGWSLEMIDTKTPCAGGSNWAASMHPNGGTPGKINSVNNRYNEENAPQLLHAFANNESFLTLYFNSTLDSVKAVSMANYAFGNGLVATGIEALPPFFNQVVIQLNTPIANGKLYAVSVKNISDCQGNVIGTKNSARFGLAASADHNDVIVNEILFNPPPMGVDYVEIYNRSEKNIDLSKLYLANRNSSNVISGIQQISKENRLLFPQEFALITIDPGIVKSQFMTMNPDAFMKIISMPSYSNTSGNVILLNLHGEIIDEVNYSEKWHFNLLKNAQGVALERINYDGPSNASNFHSAAASAGYGTPGYKNSQNLDEPTVKGDITIVPEIFSPDQDGIDDLVTIHYNFPSAGYVVNMTIFDASGRPVRYLQRNSLSGLKGYYRWDGLDDKNRKLPQGIYIIYTEIFNLDGKKKIFKNSVVLARKVN